MRCTLKVRGGRYPSSRMANKQNYKQIHAGAYVIERRNSHYAEILIVRVVSRVTDLPVSRQLRSNALGK